MVWELVIVVSEVNVLLAACASWDNADNENIKTVKRPKITHLPANIMYEIHQLLNIAAV